MLAQRQHISPEVHAQLDAQLTSIVSMLVIAYQVMGEAGAEACS